MVAVVIKPTESLIVTVLQQALRHLTIYELTLMCTKNKQEDQMYNVILVPIDISEDDLTHMVIPYVQTHAVLNTTKVHFLTVVPSLPYYSTLGMAYSAEFPKMAEIEQSALSKLNVIVQHFRLPIEKIETHVTAGSPKDQILKFADVIGANLIIIASHRPDITTYLLGSNAAAVVRHAKCPVLVVR